MMSAPRPAIPFLIVRVVVGLTALAAAIGITTALVATRPEPDERAPGEEARRITVVESFDAPVGRRWSGYGTVKARSSSDVPARVEATVVALGPEYRTGEPVARGTLLLELDQDDFRRQLQMAEQAIASLDAQIALLDIDVETIRETVEIGESELALAEADLRRSERAFADGAAMEREVDRQRQSVLQARRALVSMREIERKLAPRRLALAAERAGQESIRELAQLSLDRCRIESPIDGLLQMADIRVGEIVRVGTRVARVVDPRDLEIEIFFPSRARDSVGVGDRVIVTPERSDAVPLELSVVRVAPEDDAAGRSLRLYVETSADPKAMAPARPSETPREAGIATLEPGFPLAPGVFVAAEVEGATDRPRTLIPRRSLSEGRIMEVVEGRVHNRQVTVDFYLTGSPEGAPVDDREWAALREQLPVGTKIVLDGSRQLREGSPVTPVLARRGESTELARPGAAGAPLSARRDAPSGVAPGAAP